MGRELQKKKRKSSLPKVKQKPKSKRLLINNPIIAKHWNKKETLSQNYRRLGLTAKLQHPTGGTEKFKKDAQPDDSDEDETVKNGVSGDELPSNKATSLVPQEVSIERDPHTGAIIRILSPKISDQKRPAHGTSHIKPNEKKAASKRSIFSEWMPDSSSDNDDAAAAAAAPARPTRIADSVVSRLERQAGAVKGASKRKQSTREREWLGRLEAKYGEDYARMARDMKLNPMQQNEGDIRRRFRRWKEGD